MADIITVYVGDTNEMVPRYSLCQEYIYLVIYDNIKFSLFTEEDVEIDWPFRRRNIVEHQDVSLYGRVISISNNAPALHLNFRRHHEEEDGQEKRAILAHVPRSLSSAKAVLLTGDEENPQLRVLFFPKNSVPEMRFLSLTLLDYLEHYGWIRYADETEQAVAEDCNHTAGESSSTVSLSADK
jgi:hypothetical protein